MKTADVFVLCSGYERVSLTLLEGMPLGFECVCTRVGGISCAIDSDSGWLDEPDDEIAFVPALREGRRAAAARADFDVRFSMERCAGVYEALYEQAVGASR